MLASFDLNYSNKKNALEQYRKLLRGILFYFIEGPCHAEAWENEIVLLYERTAFMHSAMETAPASGVPKLLSA